MLDLSLQPGELSLLRQGYRNNWSQYLASLNGHGQLQSWDLCVLTASNERQADAYALQLEARRSAGTLPERTEFQILPDPAGKRIGSGGATLRVLRWIASRQDLADKRILIIHSGGDSKRLPHCSALGKQFARVPHELPDGRPSSLFDEFIVSLSGLPSQIPPGILVASGDVLLLFDHLKLSFSRPGITGVAFAAAAETGRHHGVYVSGENAQVKAFLHKPDMEEMLQAAVISDDGQVPIDTGLVWLAADAVQALLTLTQRLAPEMEEGIPINLYGDLLAPLAQDTLRDDYLADTSDGPATASLVAARKVVWETLRGLPFSVECLQPAAFVHFGTSREYIDVITGGLQAFQECGWDTAASSWLGLAMQHGGHEAVGINARAEHLMGYGSALLDSDLGDAVVTANESLLSHVETHLDALSLKSGIVLDQIPLCAGQGWVSRIWGIDDDPKRGLADGTFMGQSWPRWFESYAIDPQELWSEPDDECSLWNAQLYPVCTDRDESLNAVLWLSYPPRKVTAQMLADWRSAPRISLAEAYVQADVAAMVEMERMLQDRVAARRFLAAVEDEIPVAKTAPALGSGPVCDRRAAIVGDYLESSIDPWLPIRGYRALSAATGAQRWEDRAFSSLARLVRAHTAVCQDDISTAVPALDESTVRAWARIDLGGGWTDTPPYSLERGGQVLNAAIQMNGGPSIVAHAKLLDTLRIELFSHDSGVLMTPAYAGEVLNYANPADAFALSKAALVMRGIVPADMSASTPIADMLKPFGHGIRLETATDIPRGSGLGTSSILAGTVLQCLAKMIGLKLTMVQLFDEVLCLEQMITTGGGWQDQIGGLMPGIKLVTSLPGLPQAPQVEELLLVPELQRRLDDHLVLIYTGQRRLAKNLLRSVMGRWMARDPEMVAMLRDIADLAAAMHKLLLSGQLGAVGELLAEHWEINKSMDQGCTNPFIDELFSVSAPYLSGAKLAGAGGGGFAFGFAHDTEAKQALVQKLETTYPRSNVRIWDCSIARDQSIAASKEPALI